MAGENRNRKRNRVYYFLYVMLSLADLLRGLTALFHALVLGGSTQHCLSAYFPNGNRQLYIFFELDNLQIEKLLFVLN